MVTMLFIAEQQPGSSLASFLFIHDAREPGMCVRSPLLVRSTCCLRSPRVSATRHTLTHAT